MRVALIRHPAMEIAPGVCYGRMDLALSEAGMAAVPEIADAISGFGAACVWTSPSQRCAVVAEAVARGAEIRRDARLLELDFGEWEGVPWDDVPRVALDAWAASPAEFVAPGGESVAALVTRVTEVCAAIRQDGRDCVVVTHGGVLKVLGPLLRGDVLDLAVAAPGLGSVEIVELSEP